jgi:hypothetical protein
MKRSIAKSTRRSRTCGSPLTEEQGLGNKEGDKNGYRA